MLKTITTNFGLGDYVFVIHNDKIKRTIIDQIKTKHIGDQRYINSYILFNNDRFLGEYSDTEMFDTIDELLTNLKENYIKNLN